MKQDGFEFVAGMGYGVFEGFSKKLIPSSEALLCGGDKSIKDVSGAATVGRWAGEAVANFLLTILRSL